MSRPKVTIPEQSDDLAQVKAIQHNLEISKFAGMAQMQYMKGRKNDFVPLEDFKEQLESYLDMDNKLLDSELKASGYTEAQIKSALNTKFKPTIENLMLLLMDLKKNTHKQKEFLKESGKLLDHQAFLNSVTMKHHIINQSGRIFLSRTLISMLLIRLTDMGFTVGLYLLDKLKSDLDKFLPLAGSGDLNALDANAYNGYAKATFVNLKDMLMDFNFANLETLQERSVPEHQILKLEYKGMLLALGKEGVSSILRERQNIADKIKYFEYYPSDSDPKAMMDDLGFITEQSIGDLELISFYNMRLKPTGLTLSLIHQGLVRPILVHVNNGRGGSFKFESLEIEGSIYKDFYNVLAGNCSRTRHENKALR